MARNNAYKRIIEGIFANHYSAGSRAFEFTREEIRTTADMLGIPVPRNLGDIPYAFRYRRALPERISSTCGPDEEWIIRGVPGAGDSRYQFLIVPKTHIVPQQSLYQIKVPKATPEIVARYAQTDEQALLAHVRYNRLIDIFTGIVTYSLQSHLRTKIEGVQMETDELYLGVDKSGAQYILPVQAKGGADRLGRVQLEQDLALCRARFPQLICRAIAVQFMSDGAIAMFELDIGADERVEIRSERHYRLVSADEISDVDLRRMCGTNRSPSGSHPPRVQ